MKQMWLGRHPGVVPSRFKQQLATFAPRFNGTYQQDAHELLACLLDGIHEDLNRVRKKPYIEDKDCDGTNDSKDAAEAWKNYLRRNKSLVVDIFQGQFRNTCQCKTCGHRNIRFEPFMYLSLPISESCRKLQDCLDLYLKVDTLDGANQWYCEKCKEHVDATRKIDIWILPPILIIHLKRFKYDDFGQVGSKNHATLEYPMEKWNIADCVLGQQRSGTCYDLYAVSNHLGGLGGGHYTAHALNRFDDEWYEFNDWSCRMLSDPSEIQRNSSAYLLFYNRSEGDVPLKKLPPLIRRQSDSRPDLWPHAQVVDADFRDFHRSSRKDLSISPASTKASDKDGGEALDIQPLISSTCLGMKVISEDNAEASVDLVASMAESKIKVSDDRMAMNGSLPFDDLENGEAKSKPQTRPSVSETRSNVKDAPTSRSQGKRSKGSMYKYGKSPSITKPWKHRRRPEEMEAEV
jgi:ubiquitin carboxyl-terminal hydrolase 8